MKAEVPADGCEPDVRTDNVSDRCMIVGIGASAGGLQALRSFFGAVSPDSGLAYVVVLHLAPEYESHLVEVLQPCTTIPVCQVTESITVEPDRVYVIPPNANLVAVDAQLHLQELEKRPRDRGAIDHFFRTLAESTERSAVGVILSGSGSDGTAGLSAIKRSGGLTVAQDPDEAEFADMPRSAIASGAVELVLPVHEMPEAIRRFIELSPILPAEGTDRVLDTDDVTMLARILVGLEARTGRDFSRYKKSMILRRLSRRMQLLQVDDLAGYLDVLESKPDEARELADSLLVTVTSFFRDPEVFEAVEARVIPHLFEGKGPGDEVRVWSVGCATGEEAYTLAMLLMEEADRRESAAELRVFATDLHEGSLKRAREGLYEGDLESSVGASRRERFFRKEGDGYRILTSVREVVVFAPHNVLRDPPFSRLDLVVCRNLLIYLQRDVHGELMEIFHYALNPDGLLVLGTAETTPNEHFFHVEDKKHAIFTRRDIPSLEARLPVFRPRRTTFVEHQDRPELPPEAVAYQQLHRLLVGRAAPPSVLVGPADEVVHLSDGAGRYCVLPAGEPTANVTKLVREELRVELGVVLEEVRAQRKSARGVPIVVQLDGAQRRIVLDLRPAPPPNEGFVLVMFEERDVRAGAGKTTSDDPDDGAANRTRIVELETEVQLSRQRIEHMLDAHRGDREEMTGSMEELYSANEELHSTMEELETSKEELQSMNEELRSLDAENRQRVEELGQLTDDLQNLLAATRITTLFLDRELRILRFTPAMAELFNIRAADRGRPFSDLTHRLAEADLVGAAKEAIETLGTVEREVRDVHGRWYLARAVPYRSASGQTEGAVLALVDITLRREGEEARRQLEEERTRRATHEAGRQEERFRSLVEASAQTVWATDATGRMEEDSPTLRAFTGRTYEELRGEGWTDAFHPDDRQRFLGTWRGALAAEDPVHAEVRLWHAASDSWRWMELRAVPVRDDEGSVTGWIGMNIDIDERKQAEEARERLVGLISTVEHEERRRFSQLLHDDLQQMLYGIQLKVAGGISEADVDQRTERLGAALGILESAIVKTRQLGAELNPPVLEGEGFADALRWLRTEMWDLHGLAVEVKESGSVELEPKLRAVLFQAVRELLFNVAKHAGTDRASVEVHAPEDEDGEITLKVGDEGCGFDPKTVDAVEGDGRGFGLVSLRQRLQILGGRVDVDSRVGEGTHITIAVPLHQTR